MCVLRHAEVNSLLEGNRELQRELDKFRVTDDFFWVMIEQNTFDNKLCTLSLPGCDIDYLISFMTKQYLNQMQVHYRSQTA